MGDEEERGEVLKATVMELVSTCGDLSLIDLIYKLLLTTGPTA